MAAPRQQAQPSMAHLDALAQQQGFRDYATYSAWNNKYRAQNQRGGPVAQASPKNWMQTLQQAIPWHPSFTLEYATKKMQDATGIK